MEYGVSELLNVFGYYLDYGMAEALKTYPWQKEFLKKNKNKTLRQVRAELCSPGASAGAICAAGPVKMTIRGEAKKALPKQRNVRKALKFASKKAGKQNKVAVSKAI